MTKKGYQYWGVYETGINATPKGTKKIVEEMAGMLSNATQGGTGRKVCIQKAPKGFGTLGEPTGVCYTNGVREKIRKPRSPQLRKPQAPKPIVLPPAPIPTAAPALAGAEPVAPELVAPPKPEEK